jgi:hypothetical protein
MRLTPMEYMLVCALRGTKGGTWPEAWLRPQAKAAANRLRTRGLISRRLLKLTKRGLTAQVTNGHQGGK